MIESQRILRGRIAAHTMHSLYPATETTAAARAAFDARFQREADPDGILPIEERKRRVQHLRKAYFLRLAFLSAKARRERAQRRNGGEK